MDHKVTLANRHGNVMALFPFPLSLPTSCLFHGYLVGLLIFFLPQEILREKNPHKKTNGLCFIWRASEFALPTDFDLPPHFTWSFFLSQGCGRDHQIVYRKIRLFDRKMGSCFSVTFFFSFSPPLFPPIAELNLRVTSAWRDPNVLTSVMRFMQV